MGITMKKYKIDKDLLVDLMKVVIVLTLVVIIALLGFKFIVSPSEIQASMKEEDQTPRISLPNPEPILITELIDLTPAQKRAQDRPIDIIEIPDPSPLRITMYYRDSDPIPPYVCVMQPIGVNDPRHPGYWKDDGTRRPAP
jgi:hypothetical protein